MNSEIQNIVKFQLFPNPANDQFTISADIPLQKIIVSDVFGNVVQTISLQNEFESRLSIANLANGVYTVQVINAENMSSTQKLFVLH
jgi:HSP20 family molecular chaperone IbpA